MFTNSRKLTTNNSGIYQGGIGRGATSFSTRADLGFANSIADKVLDPFGPPPPGYAAGRGRGAIGFAGGVSRDDSVDDRGDYSDTNYDEFTGYSEGLFKDSEYNEDDRQADIVYDQIEQKMDARRRSRREARLKSELSKLRAEKPTVHQQFSDLKRSLATVSREEWESIPEIGDYALRHKQKKRQMSTPAPDSLILNAHKLLQMSVIVSGDNDLGGGISTPIGLGLQTPIGFQTPLGLQTPIDLQSSLGLQTPLKFRSTLTSNPGTMTSLSTYRTPLSGLNTPSLNDLGEARGTVLSVKLDKVMDSVNGQTVIDPKGYLTNLDSLSINYKSNIADIKKARLLLRSVIQTNPHHAPGWIAAARLEEFGGKFQAAKDIIAQGCLHCSKVDDVWLEAARLEKVSEAKAILARGLKELPQSVKLWLEAAALEENIKIKKLVLRKALQFVPNSVRLWKEAISMEPPDQAKIMLSRAVECVPQSVEMWLALSKLSSYQDAQKILNEARKQVPTSLQIWICAAKLEETYGKQSTVDIIIQRAINNLTSKGVGLDRDTWIKYAEECEKFNYLKTCQAIIHSTMDIGVEEVNCLKIWLADAENALARNRIYTARYLNINIVEKLPSVEVAWIALITLERQHGTVEDVSLYLRKAVTSCSHSESLWLMAAEHELANKNVNAARTLLAEAFTKLPDKEKISLAAVKLERENGEYERARVLLNQSRIRCNNSIKMWIQSIQLERLLKNYTLAHELCNQALNLYPDNYKLWLISGQLFLEKTPRDCFSALKQFEKGRLHCVNDVFLWISSVDIFVEQKNWKRARALLEEARLKIPKNDLLWYESVKLEIFAVGFNLYDWEKGNIFNGNTQAAHHLMSKALQECPKSGLLWAKAIFLEAVSAQNSKSVVALTQCENDANIILSVAKLFLRNNKISKARRWFNRAVTLNPRLGCAWGAYLSFECLHGDEKSQVDIIERCNKSKPNMDYYWNKIVKQPRFWHLSIKEKLIGYIEEVYPETFSKVTNISSDILKVLLYNDKKNEQS